MQLDLFPEVDVSVSTDNLARIVKEHPENKSLFLKPFITMKN